MANAQRQLLLSEEFRPRYEHGGIIGVGKRKKARPISTKQSLHLVFRAEGAKGPLCLLLPKNSRIIQETKRKFCKRYGVRIYQFSNASNHLHVLLRTRTRVDLQNFLRAFAGQTAQKITGAEKGKPFGRRFWTLLVYSRIVFWGRAFQIARKYIIQNTLETLGVIPYLPRKKKPPP